MTNMLHLTAPNGAPSAETLADMVQGQIMAIVPQPANIEHSCPLAQFQRTQQKLKSKQFAALYVYGQRICRVDLIGEWVPSAARHDRYARGLWLAILDARFSAGMANDVTLHATAADLVKIMPQVSPPTIRREVKDMADRGLLKLVSDPADQRRNLLFPAQRLMHLFFKVSLTKMAMQYGLTYNTDRLAAATFHTRWTQDFNFNPEILEYARKVVAEIYTVSRVLEVDSKQKLAVFS
jgi:hypothetical protein